MQLVSLLLIGIAAWGIGFGLISSLRVVGVVIAVGIFLFLIALVGLIGAVKHHQVLLFFVSFVTAGRFTPIRFVLNLVDYSFYNTNLKLPPGDELSDGSSWQALCVFVQPTLGTFLS